MVHLGVAVFSCRVLGPSKIVVLKGVISHGPHFLIPDIRCPTLFRVL